MKRNGPTDDGAGNGVPPGYRPVGWMVLTALCLLPLYLFLTGRHKDGGLFLTACGGGLVAVLVGLDLSGDWQTAAAWTQWLGGALAVSAIPVGVLLGVWAVMETFLAPRRTRAYNERLLAGTTGGG